MQRLLMVLILLLCSFVTNVVFAETILSGERHIPYVAGKRARNKVVVEKYKFYLSETSRIRLHFISHVRNNVSFKLIETETENTIDVLSKELDIDNSPFTQEVDLDAGKYTFIIYKEPSYGSVHNTGDYRFTFDKVEFNRSLSEKAVVESVDSDRIGNDDKAVLKGSNTEKNESSKKDSRDLNAEMLGSLADVFNILAGTKLSFIAKLVMGITFVISMLKG